MRQHSRLNPLTRSARTPTEETSDWGKKRIFGLDADLEEKGSEKEVKDAGLMRTEGKDYVMQDGDVVVFRFNV